MTVVSCRKTPQIGRSVLYSIGSAHWSAKNGVAAALAAKNIVERMTIFAYTFVSGES